LIKVKFKELEQNIGKLLIEEFNIVIANIRFKEPRIVILPKKIIKAYALNEVYNNK
jgi:hypothetical protein